MVNYTEIVGHTHAVDTRPSLPPPLEGLGTRLYMYMYMICAAGW